MRGVAALDNPVERVVDRLEALGKTVKHVNGQEMAQCPAHDDRNPSLAIRAGVDGATLFCHAGCDTADVVAAMGWDMRDLFAKNGGSPAADLLTPQSPSAAPAGIAQPRSLQWVADYIYRSAEGRPAYKITRFAQIDSSGRPVGKTFRQYRRDPTRGDWVAGLNGAEPPLYRLPDVLAAIQADRPILVVEGEKDVERAFSEGMVATTAPMGAGKWREQHTRSLAGAKVVIIADDDPPGLAHAAGVYRALEAVADSVQVLLPAQGRKDLSDHLEAGFGLAQLRHVEPADLTADPGGQDEEVTRRVVLTPAGAIGMRRVRWGWQDRMPIGELTLMPGREGTGKSLCLAWITANLTKGTLPGEFYGKPRAVLYVASEDSWAYTIAPRMVAAGADLDRVYRVEVSDVEDRQLVLPADVQLIADAAMSVDAAALMLDPIISLIDDRLSVNQARELRRALEPLRRLAEQTDMMCAALAHFNKTTDVDTLSKIPGARAWAEVARAAFGVAEDREAGHYVASQIKNNLGRLNLPNLAYRIESVEIDTNDGPANVGRLVWLDEEADAGVEEVLSRRPERRARETSDVTRMIVDWIDECGYPVPVQDVCVRFPGVKRETVKKTLARAAERGDLSNPVRGHYGPGKIIGTGGGVSP